MIRFFVYQVGLKGVWCACVFGALWGVSWLGPVLAVPWLVWHVRRQPSPAAEAALVLGAGVFGAVGDVVLIRLGGLEYAGLPDGAWLGPAWIVALWMVFATAADATLGWLRGRPALAAAIGVAGGLLAYVGGRGLGVASFDLARPETLMSFVVVWGLGVPLLVGAWVPWRRDAGDVDRIGSVSRRIRVGGVRPARVAAKGDTLGRRRTARLRVARPIGE